MNVPKDIVKALRRGVRPGEGGDEIERFLRYRLAFLGAQIWAAIEDDRLHDPKDCALAVADGETKFHAAMRLASKKDGIKRKPRSRKVGKR